MHPHTPTKEKFRPISVASPLVKFLEARLQKKLYEYMKEKLHRGQTGFVPGMGITVNQMRLVERVTERFAHNRPTYGLFLDFPMHITQYYIQAIPKARIQVWHRVLYNLS